MVRRTFISGKGILLPVSKEAIQAYEWMDKMSDNSNRDTQFQGFAKLLLEELQAIEVEGLKNNWNNIDIYRRQREAIARREYDFAVHVVENVSAYSVSSIPDMTELPKEQDEPS